MTRELHITNWYPNIYQPHEAPFIKEHFQSLPGETRRELWHVQVRTEGGWLKLHSGSLSEREHYLFLDTPIQKWRVLEWLHLQLLKKLRARLGKRWWDVVNVHIAYPLLRYPDAFRKLFGDEVVITEHWSAFHTGFHLPKGSPARGRIEQIFQQGTPVIAVSEALLRDIRTFAGGAEFPGYVIPNVVNTDLFHPPEDRGHSEHPVFVMVGNWAPIKRPMMVFKAFLQLLVTVPDVELRVVGYGAQWEAMAAWVREHGLQDRIHLLGPKQKEQIADELRIADALVHASDYETFSVVCAEAVSCGTPVVASNVGGISEFIGPEDGLLVSNTADAWNEALKRFVVNRSVWNRDMIAERARQRFRPGVVGAQYRGVLQQHVRPS